MDFETFKKLAAEFTAIPVSRRLMADVMTPVSVFLSLRQGARFPFLLESVEGGEQLARYTFLGRDPFKVLICEEDQVRAISNGVSETLDGDYFDILREWTSAWSEPNLPDLPSLTGGAVGFSSYDTVRQVESLGEARPSDLPIPEAVWAFYDEIVAFDHVKKQLVLIVTVFTEPGMDLKSAWERAHRRLDRLEERVLKGSSTSDSYLNTRSNRGSSTGDSTGDASGVSEADGSGGPLYDSSQDRSVEPASGGSDTRPTDGSAAQLDSRSTTRNGAFKLDISKMTSNVSRDHYREMVQRGKEHIFEGDIFQVVLSQRFEIPFEGDAFMLYRALRMVNPSPYLFYLDYGEYALIGSSPEVLVRVREGQVQLLPIAGTRSRGATPEEDIRLEEELRQDPKEVAEHVMLVDLGRNDLSRVCKPGSVKVIRDQIIERYSHVMHIVSDVTGDLNDHCTPVDALMQCFPAGTVSGAPKIRAMEIIDELEPTRRGPYAGAVGYFDFSGNMDTCIAIRTMVVSRDNVYIQAGAGVVADSDPDREFEETKEKAGALIEALGVALSIGERAEGEH